MRRAAGLFRRIARQGGPLADHLDRAIAAAPEAVAIAISKPRGPSACPPQAFCAPHHAAFSSEVGSKAPGGPPPPDVYEITDAASFNAAVAASATRPVILDAYAQWCAPCKQLDPVLRREVAARGGRVALARLDIDAPPLAPLVAQLQVTSVPTLIMMYGGRAVDIKPGAPAPAELAAWIDRGEELAAAVAGAAGVDAVQGEGQGGGAAANPKDLIEQGFAAARAPGAAVERVAPLFAAALNSPAADADAKAAATAGLALCAALDGDLRTAKELLANTKAAAEGAAAAAPGAPPSTAADQVAAVEAAVGLVQDAAELADGDDRTIEALEAAVAADGKDCAALRALALRLAAAGRLEEAVETALTLVKRDREWGEQAGKDLVVRVAAAAGPGSALGVAARRRLSNLWFI